MSEFSNLEREPGALSWIVACVVWFVAGGIVAGLFLSPFI